MARNLFTIAILCIFAVHIFAQQLTEGCYNNDQLESLPCGIEYQTNIAILSGLATVSSAQTLVTVGNSMHYSLCDWDLGSCSTSMVASLESGIACNSEDCSLVFDFTRPIEALEIGALLQHAFAASAIEITAFSGNQVIFQQQLSRVEQACATPSSFSYENLAGFDRVVIRGNKLVVGDISACTVQTPKIVQYTGGETCSDILIGQCNHCSDIFGVEHWTKVSCNTAGECASIRYSSENCTGLGIRTPLPKMTCEDISEFQVARGAMCFEAQLPRQ
jgi:hypothetical protein